MICARNAYHATCTAACISNMCLLNEHLLLSHSLPSSASCLPVLITAALKQVAHSACPYPSCRSPTVSLHPTETASLLSEAKHKLKSTAQARRWRPGSWPCASASCAGRTRAPGPRGCSRLHGRTGLGERRWRQTGALYTCSFSSARQACFNNQSAAETVTCKLQSALRALHGLGTKATPVMSLKG